jgi:acyl-CoA thioesterase I
LYRVALQFANGHAFFFGLALCVAACAVRLCLKNPGRWAALPNVAGLVGAAVVLLSGTPCSPWVCGLWLVACVVAFILANTARDRPNRWRLALFGVFCLISVSLCAGEIPYHLKPSIPMGSVTTLYVIGDSLSIGADAQELNWPELLGARLGLPVRNFSFGGAKVKSALYNAKRVEEPEAIVLLEIGGNDILADTDSGDFESGLTAICEAVCKPNRVVVMFSLPTPPLYNAYGAIQRRFAKEYGIALIPKRYMTRVFSAPGATIDGLHFTHAGHELMADTVAGLFVNAADDSPSQDD